MNKGQGMTLMEVIVYCVLLSLFSMMMFLSLPGRSSRATLDLQEAVQEAEVALRKLSQELANSSKSGVTAVSNPRSLVFPTAVPEKGREFNYTSDGVIAWTAWLAYALQNGRLYRYRSNLPTPVALSEVGSPPGFSSAKKGQVLVKSLKDMTLVQNPPGTWTVTLTVAAGSSQVMMHSATEVRNP